MCCGFELTCSGLAKYKSIEFFSYSTFISELTKSRIITAAWKNFITEKSSEAEISKQESQKYIIMVSITLKLFILCK